MHLCEEQLETSKEPREENDFDVREACLDEFNDDLEKESIADKEPLPMSKMAHPTMSSTKYPEPINVTYINHNGKYKNETDTNSAFEESEDKKPSCFELFIAKVGMPRFSIFGAMKLGACAYAGKLLINAAMNGGSDVRSLNTSGYVLTLEVEDGTGATQVVEVKNGVIDKVVVTPANSAY